MIHSRWSATAFAYLESLPQPLAFEVLDRTDVLSSFPELGAPLMGHYRKLGNCRQLIVKRSYRVLYLYDADEGMTRILSLQHCRQRLPTLADLRRSFRETEQEEER